MALGAWTAAASNCSTVSRATGVAAKSRTERRAAIASRTVMAQPPHLDIGARIALGGRPSTCPGENRRIAEVERRGTCDCDARLD
jgi:hypothetical protein